MDGRVLLGSDLRALGFCACLLAQAAVSNHTQNYSALILCEVCDVTS